MKTSKNKEQPVVNDRNEKMPRLITEMSLKNGLLTIQMDITKPTKKTYLGHDLFLTREIASCGKNEELDVKIVLFKRLIPERRIHI